MTKQIDLPQIATWCASNLKPRILIVGQNSGYLIKSLEYEFESRAKLFSVEHFADLPKSKTHFDLIILQGEIASEYTNGKFEISRKYILVKLLDMLHTEGSLLIAVNKKSEPFEIIIKSAGLSFACIPVRIEKMDECKYVYCCLKNAGKDLFNNHHFLQAACYDSYANDYDDDIDFLNKWLGNSQNILEIGAGSGRLALRLSPGRKCYFGIDHSASMLHQLLKKKGTLPIQVKQASMFNFQLAEKFDCVIFPFRVLPYSTNEKNLVSTLSCAKNHLNPGGRLLINMLDFSQEFVNKWDQQSVSSDFTGPDGEAWNKTDVMTFKNNIMYRRIDLRRNGILICQNEDNLMWMNAKVLSSLVEKVGLKVSNIWPAYSWSKYQDKDEYVLEARNEY